MKKRQLQRARKGKKKNSTITDTIMKTKAEKTAQAAVRGEPTIDCLGNFIFFSTPSGEGWMLDHRNNYALRLAENYQVLPYTIIETAERFQVEWKERFRIEGELFIASYRDKETVFSDYPVEAITGLIGLITEKQNSKHSPGSLSEQNKVH